MKRGYTMNSNYESDDSNSFPFNKYGEKIRRKSRLGTHSRSSTVQSDTKDNHTLADKNEKENQSGESKSCKTGLKWLRDTPVKIQDLSSNPTPSNSFPPNSQTEFIEPSKAKVKLFDEPTVYTLESSNPSHSSLPGANNIAKYPRSILKSTPLKERPGSECNNVSYNYVASRVSSITVKKEVAKGSGIATVSTDNKVAGDRSVSSSIAINVLKSESCFAKASAAKNFTDSKIPLQVAPLDFSTPKLKMNLMHSQAKVGSSDKLETIPETPQDSPTNIYHTAVYADIGETSRKSPLCQRSIIPDLSPDISPKVIQSASYSPDLDISRAASNASPQSIVTSPSNTILSSRTNVSNNTPVTSSLRPLSNHGFLSTSIPHSPSHIAPALAKGVGSLHAESPSTSFCNEAAKLNAPLFVSSPSDCVDIAARLVTSHTASLTATDSFNKTPPTPLSDNSLSHITPLSDMSTLDCRNNGSAASLRTPLSDMSPPDARNIGSAASLRTPLSDMSPPDAHNNGSAASLRTPLSDVSPPNDHNIGSAASLRTPLSDMSLPNSINIGSATSLKTPLSDMSMPDGRNIESAASLRTPLSDESPPEGHNIRSVTSFRTPSSNASPGECHDIDTSLGFHLTDSSQSNGDHKIANLSRTPLSDVSPPEGYNIRCTTSVRTPLSEISPPECVSTSSVPDASREKIFNNNFAVPSATSHHFTPAVTDCYPIFHQFDDIIPSATSSSLRSFHFNTTPSKNSISHRDEFINAHTTSPAFSQSKCKTTSAASMTVVSPVQKNDNNSILPQPVEQFQFQVPEIPANVFRDNYRSAARFADNDYFLVKGRKYKIIKEIGRGGSSKVYEVQDMQSKELRALKRIDLTDVDEGIAKGYRSEVQHLIDLQQCKQVIRIFASEEIRVMKEGKKKTYLQVVMEKGTKDLAKQLKEWIKDGDLTYWKIMDLWTTMLTAVNEIHKAGKVHSDLKPANFLFIDMKVKLIDFGIASSVPTDVTSIFKDTMAGTMMYMSPEALKCHRFSSDYAFKVSPKSDVWSLGCILYYMVYGVLPFAHIRNEFARREAIISEEDNINYPPSENLTPFMKNTLKACLQKIYSNRPDTSTLLTAVENYRNLC